MKDCSPYLPGIGHNWRPFFLLCFALVWDRDFVTISPATVNAKKRRFPGFGGGFQAFNCIFCTSHCAIGPPSKNGVGLGSGSGLGPGACGRALQWGTAVAAALHTLDQRCRVHVTCLSALVCSCVNIIRKRTFLTGKKEGKIVRKNGG